MPAAPIRKILDLETINACTHEWKHRPVKPELRHGYIHIWKIHLDAEESVKHIRRVLSNDERLRTNRFIFPRQRSRFQAGRAALRNILSIYLKQTPESIQFSYGLKGKPFLQPNAHLDLLEFNIAHSEELMLAAFSLDGALGIDLECEQTTSTRDWIVKQYFSSNDYQIYQSLPAGQKQAAFLRAWTAKEACGKAHGKGFSAPLNMDHFRLEDADQFPEEPEFIHYGDYWLLHFRTENGGNAAAAVKTARKPQPIFWEYNWDFPQNFGQIAQNG